MGKALQKSTDGGQTFQQVSVDVAHYTIRTGVVANIFYSVKDSNNNTYILCGLSTNDGDGDGVVIKITNAGVITKSLYNNSTVWSGNSFNESYGNVNPVLSRDETKIFFKLLLKSYTQYSVIVSLNVADIGSGNIILDNAINPVSSRLAKFAIYKDQYIWVASGNTVRIYDHDTKAELASVAPGESDYLISCDANNNLYALYLPNDTLSIRKLVFSGSVINKTNVLGNSYIGDVLYPIKQVLIDKWGDLIFLRNSGSNSKLVKYTTAGVQVGTTLDLSGAYYNLNTDSDGNYYYSNDLGTYKIAANTAQGQAFNTPVKIRDNGMTTYGNNMTGYSPAVNA